MSDLINALILGVIQGVTEFLPVSSSGHLVVVRDFFGITGLAGNQFLFDILLHVATALAIVVYFRKDLWLIVKGENTPLLVSLIVGTIPVVVFGLVFRGLVSGPILRTPVAVAIALILGSVVMWFADWKTSRGGTIRTVNIREALIAGLFQAIALVPGASRSGMTISGGLFSGLSREVAARFAFLLGVPAILGAGFLELVSSREVITSASILPILLGSVAAFVVGLLVIHFLLEFLRRRSLGIFIWYRVVLALVILVLLFW